MSKSDKEMNSCSQSEDNLRRSQSSLVMSENVSRGI